MTSIPFVGGDRIGEGEPAYIIAEMSANHANELERAKDILHAAADAGADAIKTQTYTPDTMTIDCERSDFLLDEGPWEGRSLYELYEEASTPWDWQGPLMEEAEDAGVDFLSTAYEKHSARFLQELGVEAFKIASFECTHIPLLEEVASYGKPVILSTGLATLAEIDEAVGAMEKAGDPPLGLLACTSAYPASPEDVNLRTIPHLSETYNVPAGFSDHTLGSAVPVAAVSMGAAVIEKHVCLSRDIENPDASFSMEPDEFDRMINQIRTVERARGEIAYGASDGEQSNRQFRRSIYAVEPISKGETFTEDNIRVIRPSYGLAPEHYPELMGRRSRTDIERGTPLDWTKIE